MNCCKCGKKLSILDTRTTRRGTRYRRRICPFCGHRETTYELSKAQYEKMKTAIAIVDALRKVLKKWETKYDSSNV